MDLKKNVFATPTMIAIAVGAWGMGLSVLAKALDLYMLGGGLPVYHYTKKNLDFCRFCF